MDLQQRIDGLLERHLGLLDEYTRLRGDLTKLQTGVYHNIARANFSAERGMRYGTDHYDERMQATRRLDISTEDAGLPIFAMTTSTLQNEAAEQAQSDDVGDKESHDSGDAGPIEDEEKGPAKPKKPSDPLRWFGFLVPTALRTAQEQSIQAVEQVIPQLASVNAKMLAVEIEIRRARKWRARAEAAEHKTKQHLSGADADEAQAQQVAVKTS